MLVGQQERHLVQVLEQIEFVQVPTTLLVLLHVVRPQVLRDEGHHVDDVVLVGQRHEARLAEVKLQNLRLSGALALGLRAVTCDRAHTVRVDAVLAAPCLAQELRELNTLEPGARLPERVLVLDHELRRQAGQLQAVLHERGLQLLRQVLARERRLGAGGPAHLAGGAAEDRKDRGAQGRLEGRRREDRLQSVAPDGEHREELIQLHAAEDHLRAAMADQLMHGTRDDTLQQHLVPTLVQGGLPVSVLGQRQRLPRGQEGEAAMNPRRAVRLEGCGQANADSSATVLLLEGLDAASGRAVGVQGHAEGPLELILQDLQHRVVRDAEPVRDGPLRRCRALRAGDGHSLRRPVAHEGADLQVQRGRGDLGEEGVELVLLRDAGLDGRDQLVALVELQASEVLRKEQHLLGDGRRVFQLLRDLLKLLLQTELRPVRAQG
mmetsp:Transcript_20448/g.59282  ORF Transcript_20448/g.59282 Transcript_20448/m.59282 type:complete len:436 (-) Transcript_20448:429-1736(-)